MKISLIACLGIAIMYSSCKKDDTPIPTPDPLQTVTAISPTSGPKNTTVTITGTNFGTNTAVLKVYFNGIQSTTVLTATGTQITATVPTGAGTGAVKVEKNSVQVTGPVFTYQPLGTVTTLSLTGAATTLNRPSGIVRDASGNLYVCDRDNHRIVKITPAGVGSVFAGSGASGFTNGTGSAAQFNQPYAITIDFAGNFYVGDRINHAIRKITSTGVVTTLAGNGVAGNSNGTGGAASFNEPLGVTVDVSGNIYVADYINSSLRKITPAGVVTTLTSITNIFGVTVDASGNLYCAQYGNHVVSKYSSTGVYSVIAGMAGTSGTTDGTGAAARFNFPAGITIDGNGNLYVTETFNNRIRKITAAGVVTTIAGNTSGFADGIGTAALFDAPIAVTGDFASDFIYIADFGNNKIRKVNIE
jgi:hypothetical protein